MAISLTINGQTFEYPQNNDTDWGPDATGWAAAVTAGMLQKAGGLFQLLAEVDFGTSHGLKSLYYKSRATNPASAGQVRLGRSDVISWRNEANNADLTLSVDSSNNLQFNGVNVVSGFSVSDTTTIDLTLAASVLSAAINNDSITNAMINSAAAIQYSKLDLSGSIVNSDISASAGIAFSKLASLTSGNILVGNGSNVAASVAMSGDITINNAGATSYNGIVPLNKGGTAKALTAVAGGVVYTDADSFEVTSAGTSGQYLKSNGSSAPSFQSFTPPLVTKYTSGSGTHTLTGSPLYIRVVALGGGGGGGGGGTASGGNGTNGGNTTFSNCTAGGGTAGNARAGGGGAGGAATVGSGWVGEGIDGGQGQNPSANNNTTAFVNGGAGGNSARGGAGQGGLNSGGGQPGAATSGAGGGGGGSNATTGGSGGNGGGSGAYLDVYISGADLAALSGSFSYSVGTAGSGGSAGTNGTGGGGGGTGQILVFEYYQ